MNTKKKKKKKVNRVSCIHLYIIYINNRVLNIICKFDWRYLTKISVFWSSLSLPLIGEGKELKLTKSSFEVLTSFALALALVIEAIINSYNRSCLREHKQLLYDMLVRNGMEKKILEKFKSFRRVPRSSAQWPSWLLFLLLLFWLLDVVLVSLVGLTTGSTS